MSEPKMPDALAEILAEPGWWRSDDGELFLWEGLRGGGGPAVRVEKYNGGWWVLLEGSRLSALGLDELLAVMGCMVRVHRAIKTPLGQFTRSLEELAEMTTQGMRNE